MINKIKIWEVMNFVLIIFFFLDSYLCLFVDICYRQMYKYY